MKKILIANLFGIGDVLFTTPLAANLKKEFAGVRVDYLCNARAKDVVEDVPDVDKIYVYEKDDFGGLWEKSKTAFLKESFKLFSSVKKEKYDAVFDFTLSRQFDLFFTLAGIKKRIGLNYKNRGIFLSHSLDLTGFEGKHVVEYYLSLLETLNISPSIKEMQLVPDEMALEWASNYMKDNRSVTGKIVAVIPGGGASWGKHAYRKRWKAGSFSKTGDLLAKKGVEVAVLGDPSEKSLCEEIADGMNIRPAIVDNTLSLRQYIALLDRFDLVLCNDGGPLHIAAALGKKTVSIFGPVDEKVYGPYPFTEKHRVVKLSMLECRPCYNRFKLKECDKGLKCITDITPERVAVVCLELLK